MKSDNIFSILYPDIKGATYKQLSPTSCHDLGLDTICKKLTNDPKEQNMIMGVISNMTSNSDVAAYRQKVFVDIKNQPKLREELTALFDKVEFIRNFGIKNKEMENKIGLWHLMHRLDELKDYIRCVEDMRNCLTKAELKSDGLIGFREYVNALYEDALFEQMKKDIEGINTDANSIQSITVGINVNSRLEAISMGLISVNDKPFKKSSIVSNFADTLSSKDKIHEGTQWDGDMHYQQVAKPDSNLAEELLSFQAALNPFQEASARQGTLAKVAEGDGLGTSTFYLENLLNKLMGSLVKKLREVLTKYSNIAVVNISRLIPEFVYYFRLVEFVEKCEKDGFPFCEASIINSGDTTMRARDFYNLKLAVSLKNSEELVPNDLDFDPAHTVYILTGANRGGKTTVTQAVGLLYAFAQGGSFVPARIFEYKPVDAIYTHFPADEDKTIDYGRLGEECVRFKELYAASTKESLLLLNESFATTSFEEGYYIARDSVKAILKKQTRTIYNTHMHNLAMNLSDGASSLIVKADGGKRSFKVEVAPPEGNSYAKDIAEKYGVTYEMLTGE